jgi:tetraacyldisaccharide 4'-kinase
VAAYLRDQGRRPAILSRGYRAKGSGVRVVSTGEGPLLGPLAAGDEPVLLAGELPGVAVVVGPDRAVAGRHALERLMPPPDLFILDDGFSHLRLFRDIDLVAFPGDDPYAGGRLPPGGRLREPLAAMRRADAAILTAADPAAAGRFAETLRPFGFDGPAFACAMAPQPAVLVEGRPLPPGSAVVAVAAIARPERFLDSIRRQQLRVTEVIALADHHRYPERSLRRIEDAWHRTRADAVLTTSKDRVKLMGRLDAPLAELPIRAVPEGRFWHWLDRRLSQQVAEVDRGTER